MDLVQLIEKTRTYHRFTTQKVDPSTVEKALQLSLSAPNHRYTFPWRYFWVGPKVREEIYQIALEAQKAKQSEMTAEDVEQLKEKMLYPELVFFGKVKSENAATGLEDYATLSCSVQLLALALAEKGVGYKWNTGKVAMDKKVHSLVGVPEDCEIVGLIQIGFPVSEAGPKRRPSLSEVLRRTS